MRHRGRQTDKERYRATEKRIHRENEFHSPKDTQEKTLSGLGSSISGIELAYGPGLSLSNWRKGAVYPFNILHRDTSPTPRAQYLPVNFCTFSTIAPRCGFPAHFSDEKKQVFLGRPLSFVSIVLLFSLLLHF